MTSQKTWDASFYDESLGIVTRLGAGVVDLLAAKPGERILDLGCGTGHHAAQLAEAGASVIGIDSSAGMIARARQQYPDLDFRVAAGESFLLDEPVDAVFTNAALHWMRQPRAVAEHVFAALRPGGRYVGEFGGKHNVATVTDALNQALQEFNLPEVPLPWYFPSPGEYASLLEAVGFEVTLLYYFPRPTPLDDAKGGIADWTRMFADDYFANVPESARPAIIRRAADICRPVLFHDGSWWADYVRLRFMAIRPA